LEILSMNY